MNVGGGGEERVMWTSLGDNSAPSAFPTPQAIGLSYFNTKCVYGLDIMRKVSGSSVTKIVTHKPRQHKACTAHSRPCISTQREGILSYSLPHVRVIWRNKLHWAGFAKRLSRNQNAGPCDL